MTIEELMRLAHEKEASDLILVPGREPCIYVHGRLLPLLDDTMMPPVLQEMFDSFMTANQKKYLEECGDVDFSYGVQGLGRVRVNIHKQRGSLAAAIRFIHARVPTFAELNLPDKLNELAQLPRGLVLVTGSTGSGKSTTLAAMIEYMNDCFEKHIITLEDPIEYLFSHRRCIIEQREIGEDSPSFVSALRHVVRQKPDVILVGEMRDRETIATALTAAETGHLVLGTLHTNTASETIERVIDVFEASHQPQIRIQLANTLRAVICQSLLRCLDMRGMIPAIEMMLITPAIRRAIRECDTHLIPGMIETGQKFGMYSLDQSLADLVASGRVAIEDAINKAIDPERLERLIAGRTAHGKPRISQEPETGKEPANGVCASPTASRPWH